jgi:hypothetical protein
MPRLSDSQLIDRKRASSNARIMIASRGVRDIASSCPEIRNRRRRNKATRDLQFFLKTYFPSTFSLPWSEDHLKVIAQLQATIDAGGQFALAMPRGSGKTSLIERAALWAILTGRRRFVVIVSANEGMAEQSLARIKSELEFNDLLYGDWPKSLHGIRKLESQARRCVGQLWDDVRTCITWLRKRVVMPTVPRPNSESSGAIIHVAGITGAIRGLSHTTPEGRTIRPDLLLVDDPSDREAARSPVQTAERLALLNGDLMGISGPGKKIAALCATTVIFRNDLADQLLAPAKCPSWRGEKYKLVYDWPSSPLWEQYQTLRREGFLPGGDRGKGATEFYRVHRAEMDVGARVAWPERYEPGELSAIQHAFNLRMDRGQEAFMSEYQNEPVNQVQQVEALDPVTVAARCGGFERGVAPPEVEKLTAFVDVGQELHWWMVCGWSENFDCHILDYGPFPEQRSRVFLSRHASPTLGQIYPGGTEAAVYAGLKSLVDKLIGREWRRSDGATLPISRILIDSGWETKTVRLFIRQSAHRERITLSKGYGLGPQHMSMAEYRKQTGQRIGDNWVLDPAGADQLRLLRFDTNPWKSRLADMLARPMGLKAGVTLFGDRPADHELLALHLTSELPTRVEAKGRSVNVWSRRADRENHLLDCLVGAAVAATLEGVSPLFAISGAPVVRQERKRVSFAAQHAAAKRRREGWAGT